MDIESAIKEGMTQLALSLPTEAPTQLARYLTLLDRWNQVYNLTAVRDIHEMVTRHILDSLSIIPWIKGPHVLDVGSGAGLPGIPLAIALPQHTFYLLDSQIKRTRFMTQAVAELGLKNVRVVCSRVEPYVPTLRFDSVVSRAFATLSEMVQSAGHLCAPEGHLLAMKGAFPTDELAKLPVGYAVIDVQMLIVPGLAAQRHVVRINREIPHNFR